MSRSPILFPCFNSTIVLFIWNVAPLCMATWIIHPFPRSQKAFSPARVPRGVWTLQAAPPVPVCFLEFIYPKPKSPIQRKIVTLLFMGKPPCRLKVARATAGPFQQGAKPGKRSRHRKWPSSLSQKSDVNCQALVKYFDTAAFLSHVIFPGSSSHVTIFFLPRKKKN